MVEQSSPKELLGFLSVEKTHDENGYIGAFMVTDYRGYPLEFRATTPVRPSLVQKALYGAQLEHFVSVQLCARTLIQQISRKPVVLLVSNSNLLDVATETGTDVLAVWVTGQALTRPVTSNSTIRGPAGSRDIAYEKRLCQPDREAHILSFVETCAGHFDLIEAFERMNAALSLLPQEDKRFA
jgi:hypothetical protein